MRSKALLIGLPALLGLGTGAALAFFICALTGNPAILPAVLSVSGEPQEMSPTSDNNAVYEAAVSAARAIYNADFVALSAAAHPEMGCLFAPFSTVDREENLVFTPAQIRNMAGDKTEYEWGKQESAGQPLTLTPVAFFRDILQIRDFSAAPSVGFDMVLRTGNAVENVLTEYPGCRVVDLYCPNTGKDPAGTDWASLKLVFEDNEGEWSLVAVVRSVYTEQ